MSGHSGGWRSLLARLRPETRALLVFVPAVCLGLNLLIPLLPGQPRGVMTSLDYTGAWLKGTAHEDSWKPMRLARDWLGEPREGLLYQDIFFEGGVKLQYPPTSLLPLDALAAAIPDGTSNEVLNDISWLAVWIAMLLAAFALERSVRAPPDPLDRTARVVLALVAGACFYPLVRGFYLGQVQTWIDALVAGLVLAWIFGRPATSGALTALVCLIKPQLALLLLWGVLRGHWRFAAGFAAVAVVGIGASLALYGFANHLDYLEVLSYIGRHGESFHPNQSVNGLVHRMLGNGNNLHWVDGFPPFDGRVYAATLASSLVLLGAALFWRRGDAKDSPQLDLAIVIVSVTIASPIAWAHHYALLLPLFALALPACSALRKRRGLALAGLGVAFLLVANTFRFTNRLAEGPLNFLQSYVLFGGLLFLCLLYWLRACAGETEARVAPHRSANS